MPQKIKCTSGLGHQLRCLRLEAGFTVAELARAMQLLGCDTTRETLVKIEGERHHVSMEQLKAIKAALGISSYDEIFNFLEEE